MNTTPVKIDLLHIQVGDKSEITCTGSVFSIVYYGINDITTPICSALSQLHFVIRNNDYKVFCYEN